MVEYTKDKKPSEIKALGYTDLGIYEEKNKELSKLVM